MLVEAFTPPSHIKGLIERVKQAEKVSVLPADLFVPTSCLKYYLLCPQEYASWLEERLAQLSLTGDAGTSGGSSQIDHHAEWSVKPVSVAC